MKYCFKSLHVCLIPMFETKSITKTKTKTKYVVINKTLYVPHNFREKIDLECEELKDINTLIFNENHNKGRYSMFNHPIVLTPNIICITFGKYFNRPIVLTPKITILTLGFWYNKPIILTPNIMVLTIDCNNHNISDNLPNNIKHLTLG